MKVKKPKLKKITLRNLKSINDLKFSEQGLIPVVVQDYKKKMY